MDEGRAAGIVSFHPAQKHIAVARWTVGIAAVPLAINLLFDRNPPYGIYIQGAVIGSLYGLIAIGLILVYRANRVVNFGQASMGAAAASLAVLLMAARGVPWVLAVLILLVASAASGAVVDGLVVQRFHHSPRLVLTVATIGVAQVFGFVELFLPRWIGGDRNPLARVSALQSPFHGLSGQLGGVVLTGDHLFAVIVVSGACLGLQLFLTRTNLGLSIRASAENADRASLLGVRVRLVSTSVWMIAGVLSGIGVFLRVPLVGSLPGGGLLGTSTLLFALAPAVIARMDRFGMALAAGIAMGMLDQAVFFATGNATISSAVLLPVLLVALLVQRSSEDRAQDSGTRTWQEVREQKDIPAQLRGLLEVRVLRALTVGGGIGALLLMPFIVGELRRDFASLMVIYAIIGVSLVVLTGWAGQISLGQFAVCGVGAAVAGALVADAGWDFVVAAPAGALAGAIAAVIIGLPAVRLPGLLLAVTTLAFSSNTQFLVLNPDYNKWLLPELTNSIPRPILWGRIDATSDAGFYWLCLACLGVVMLAARSLRAKRGGRVLIATRDNARGAQAFGVDPVRVRLAAFAISGLFCGLAGALLAHLQGVVDAAVFTPQRSLQLFAMTVIGGLTSVSGAVLGAAYIAVFQYFLPDYQLLASGAGMLLLLVFFPGGIAEALFAVRDHILRAIAHRHEILVPSLLADRSAATGEPVDADADFAVLVADATEPTPADTKVLTP